MVHDEAGLISLHGPELAERSSTSRLLGAPPGYLGYGTAAGTLVDAVRRRPHCVLLVRDVDRAHPEVQAVLAGIASTGTLTDAAGRTASFRSAFVVFTLSEGEGARAVSSPAAGSPGSTGSTVDVLLPSPSAAHQQPTSQLDGATAAAAPQAAGAAAASGATGVVGAIAHDGPAPHINSTMTSLLGSVDAVIRFKPLTPDAVGQIVDAQLEHLSAALSRSGAAGSGRGVVVQLDAAARAWLARAGYSQRAGAAPLAGVLRQCVLAPVGELLLQQRQVEADLGNTAGSASATCMVGDARSPVGPVRVMATLKGEQLRFAMA